MLIAAFNRYVTLQLPVITHSPSHTYLKLNWLISIYHNIGEYDIFSCKWKKTYAISGLSAGIPKHKS